MTAYLVHLLVWTGLLIALVLVLRRPVARFFGPQAAYALWLLPFLRLLVPPIELPAWLAPKPVATHGETADIAFVIMGDPVALPVYAATETAMDWTALMIAVWLGGAAMFLARRFALYFRMRDALLVNAVPVGKAGRIRLVETTAANSPVAFGVIDKVIALPPGFMARHDRTGRDLALAHELAHHRGHDLMANFAAQPLFALHWFNPLGWYGWSAMRRDQEAACDARVVANCARELRGTYASVIASFAAGPHVALAAPMACPVLGQKSVIHRLRSLTMNDISPRRRVAGRVLLALGVLALPTTASFTFAEARAAQRSPEAPDAPLPPEPPAPPEAPDAPEPPVAIETIELPPSSDRSSSRHVVIVRREREPGDASAHGGHPTTERRTQVFRVEEHMSEEERARLKAELRDGMAEMHAGLEEARNAQRLAMIEMRRGLEGAARVEMRCDNGKPGTSLESHDGRRVVVMCKKTVNAQALAGLAAARASIAGTHDMDERVRLDILRSLDAEIARLARERE